MKLISCNHGLSHPTGASGSHDPSSCLEVMKRVELCPFTLHWMSAVLQGEGMAAIGTASLGCWAAQQQPRCLAARERVPPSQGGTGTVHRRVDPDRRQMRVHSFSGHSAQPSWQCTLSWRERESGHHTSLSHGPHTP